MQYPSRLNPIPIPQSRLKFENEDERAEPSSRKEYLRALLYILPILIFTLFFILTCVLLSKAKGFPWRRNSEASSVMKYLEFNLNLSPIEEIVMKSKGQDCPLGFSPSKIGEFYGFKSGCLCENGEIHSKAYCWLKKSLSCKSFDGKPKQNLHLWRSLQFCAKRFQEWKFVVDGTDCSKIGLKRCQDYICINSNLKCPITSITISTQLSTPPTTDYQDIDRIRFKFERETAMYPLVELDSGNIKVPCVVSGKEPNLPFKPYPLDINTNKGCGEYGDKSSFSKEIDKMDLYEFYNTNGILIPDPPYLTTYFHPNYISSLFSIQRVPTSHKPECQDIKANEVGAISSDSNNLLKIVVGFGVTILILCLIGIIFSILFLVRGKLKFSFLRSSKFFLGIFVLILITIVLIIILAIVFWSVEAASSISSTKSHFDLLLTHNCLTVPPFREAGKDIIFNSEIVSNNVSPLISWMFGLSLATAIGLFVILFLRKKKGLNPIPIS